MADLDGDGRLDVAVASAGPPGLPGSVAVFFQAPAPAAPGTLLPPTLYTGYQGPLSMVAADVDGDTRPDLVIADGLASIRYQGPGGRFLAADLAAAVAPARPAAPRRRSPPSGPGASPPSPSARAYTGRG